MTPIPHFKLIVNGQSMASVGLGDAWVVRPDHRAMRVTGVVVKPGMGIVESLLADLPEDHFVIFDPSLSEYTHVLVLH